MTNLTRDSRALTTNEMKAHLDRLCEKPDLLKLTQFIRDLNVSKLYSGAQAESLLADRTYYVRKDGSDSNDGRVDNADGAFLTIQAAIDNLREVSANGYTITIQVGAGTYAEDITWYDRAGETRRENMILRGDPTTPANVTIECYYACLAFADVNVNVIGFTLLTNYTYTSYGEAVEVYSHSNVWIENCVFAGTGFVGVAVFNGGQALLKDCTISGDYQTVLSLFGSSAAVFLFGTITIPAAQNWANAFVEAFGPSYMQSQATFAGTGATTSTGKRYSAQLNGIVNSFGGGASYFPGDVAGTTATGGQYV